MAYLKYIIIMILLLPGLVDPVFLNNLSIFNRINSGLAHGDLLNTDPSHARAPDTPLFYFEHKAPVREANGQTTQQFNLVFKGKALGPILQKTNLPPLTG